MSKDHQKGALEICFSIVSPILPKKLDTRLKATWAMAVAFPFMVSILLAPVFAVLFLVAALFGGPPPSISLDDIIFMWIFTAIGGAFIGLVGHRKD